jgi:glutamate N-acetyltransferase/amino-acid N-acetyltransferase
VTEVLGAAGATGAALPRGFSAAGVACGIKASGRPDLGLLVCAADDASSAAMFTRNAIVAAPVTVSRRAALDRLRAVVVNSGNANVCDGQRGLETAEAMARAVAEGLAVDPARVGVASTGVIAVDLPRGPVLAGIGDALGALSEDGGLAFSEAILTTDRGTKRASLAVDLPGGTVRLCAQAKGAGMISPSFATMLCFVETDARIDPVTLERTLRAAAERSFERISVDGQLSTNDSVFAIASGASGVQVEGNSEADERFSSALIALLRQLALEMVADGEGAARVARLVVGGPMEAVEPVARSIADSPLVRTALHGADPNWGRMLAAAGQAIPDAGGAALDLWIEEVQVAAASQALPMERAQRQRIDAAMRADEVEFRLRFPDPVEEAEVFFCDLGHDYVSLNSDYST